MSRLYFTILTGNDPLCISEYHAEIDVWTTTHRNIRKPIITRLLKTQLSEQYDIKKAYAKLGRERQ